MGETCQIHTEYAGFGHPVWGCSKCCLIYVSAKAEQYHHIEYTLSRAETLYGVLSPSIKKAKAPAV